MQQYLGFTAGRWLWSVQALRQQPDYKNSKKRAERSERLMSRQGTAIISALVIIIVCLSWAVNHYRINAITYKAQRDKNARGTEMTNAAIAMTCRCVSVMLLRSMQNTRRLTDAKTKKMMLCVMMLPLVVVSCVKQSVSQCVVPPPPA